MQNCFFCLSGRLSIFVLFVLLDAFQGVLKEASGMKLVNVTLSQRVSSELTQVLNQELTQELNQELTLHLN